MRSFSTSSFEPTGSEERKNHLRTLKSLVVYLWPQGRLDLKFRVILALASLALPSGDGLCAVSLQGSSRSAVI